MDEGDDYVPQISQMGSGGFFASDLSADSYVPPPPVPSIPSSEQGKQQNFPPSQYPHGSGMMASSGMHHQGQSGYSYPTSESNFSPQGQFTPMPQPRAPAPPPKKKGKGKLSKKAQQAAEQAALQQQQQQQSQQTSIQQQQLGAPIQAEMNPAASAFPQQQMPQSNFPHQGSTQQHWQGSGYNQSGGYQAGGAGAYQPPPQQQQQQYHQGGVSNYPQQGQSSFPSSQGGGGYPGQMAGPRQMMAQGPGGYSYRPTQPGYGHMQQQRPGYAGYPQQGYPGYPGQYSGGQTGYSNQQQYMQQGQQRMPYAQQQMSQYPGQQHMYHQQRMYSPSQQSGYPYPAQPQVRSQMQPDSNPQQLPPQMPMQTAKPSVGYPGPGGYIGMTQQQQMHSQQHGMEPENVRIINEMRTVQQQLSSLMNQPQTPQSQQQIQSLQQKMQYLKSQMGPQTPQPPASQPMSGGGMGGYPVSSVSRPQSEASISSPQISSPATPHSQQPSSMAAGISHQQPSPAPQTGLQGQPGFSQAQTTTVSVVTTQPSPMIQVSAPSVQNIPHKAPLSSPVVPSSGAQTPPPPPPGPPVSSANHNSFPNSQPMINSPQYQQSPMAPQHPQLNHPSQHQQAPLQPAQQQHHASGPPVSLSAGPQHMGMQHMGNSSMPVQKHEHANVLSSEYRQHATSFSTFPWPSSRITVSYYTTPTIFNGSCCSTWT